MEQMYLIEVFIDKVTIYTPENEESGANKGLIIKSKFGPKTQFIVKEGQLAVNEKVADDIVECDENGKRKWSRTIRVGKSYLFPSYPDTVLLMLSKFPLEIEIWNDDENETEIFVGVGSMQWDTEFYLYLKETADACKLHEPIAIKQNVMIWAECCCKKAGEVDIIVRLSALGDSIITEFQQLMADPEKFCFRTNKAPSMFQCQRIEGDNPNFCMMGSIYETTTLEDPDIIASANKKIEVCTELQSCGFNPKGLDVVCDESHQKPAKKEYPIDKIRMGDITGPCGNANCPLAHKVRAYIRNLEGYRKQTGGQPIAPSTEHHTKKVCGSCDCKDDRYHRGVCSENTTDTPKQDKVVCKECGGKTQKGNTCEDRMNKMYNTGLTPKGSPTSHTVNYMTGSSRPELMQSLFGKDFVVQNISTKFNCEMSQNQPTCSQGMKSMGCGCRKALSQVVTTTSAPNIGAPDNKHSVRSFGLNNQFVYNAETGKGKISVYNCTEVPEDMGCKCNPPKPSPPCRTFDCDCIQENINIAARKAHKPYCPSYKHKSNCPVTQMNDEEEKKEDDDDEAEPLPYGLPPIQLGPCPVLGRPCTVPDGFARMYKTGALPALPPSYNESGKVCCSKEYERIKKAIKEYMKNEKENDFRCLNTFNVDTERRCCDKEQMLLALMGKGCCGSHKISIQNKFEEKK